jgi:ribonuclease R
MPLRYKRRLLAYMQHESYRPTRLRDLAQDLGIDDEDDFEQAITDLAEQGIVRLGEGGIVSLPSFDAKGGEVTGVFRKHPRGFGFLKPDEPVAEGDLFVPARETSDAASGDRVRAEIRRDRRRGGWGGGGTKGGAGDKAYVGSIVEVLERKRTNFAGAMFKQGALWLMAPDGRGMTEPIVVRDAASKNVNEGDKVVIEMIEFPEGDNLGEGVIVKVLGDAGRPDVETQAVIYAHHLPEEFPDACITQARDLTAYFDEEIETFRSAGSLDDREDMTGEFICTIDPPDAKDYDDAISISRTKDGGWKLGVHIADVAHFVRPVRSSTRRRGSGATACTCRGW